MPVFPNLRRTNPPGLMRATTSDTPVVFVDTPAMNYATWLQQSGDGIAQLPGDPSQLSVAVVGAGAAGLAAAYELLRCGLSVTLYEAGSRAGGRLYSIADSSGNLFEMGAMRFTPSEQVLHWYAGLFGLQFSTGDFPDPLGADETFIAFQGQTYVYTPGAQNQLPPSFPRVNDGWNAFMDNGFTSADGSISLTAPKTITQWLSAPQGNEGEIVQAWQAYIDAFGNSSLYEAMVRIFTDPNAPGPDMSLPPADRVWNETDFEFLGALGTGIGGFGPLFPIGFLDIMRFTVNAVETDQHELPSGVASIVDGFLNQPVAQPNGNVTSVGASLFLNTPVAAVTPAGGFVTLTFADGTEKTFDRAIVATSHRSMELTMGLGAPGALAEPVATAVRRVHLENSSKVFVESAAFWDQPQPGTNHDWPRNVVGDTILRNFYALTYPQATPDTGAVLFSYTWADDSVKPQTLTDPQARLALLLRDLATISPELRDQVETSMDPASVQIIDWQSQPYFFGAFKLNHPGEDPYVQAMYYDFLKAGTQEDTGVYIAGDSVGFLGGWVENAFQTGLNAAAGVAVSLGGTLVAAPSSPFAQLNPNTYDYVVPGSAGAERSADPVITAERPRRGALV
ncbi:NAD(P)/FAD-dependent oxidoreductase [Longimicrobium sp.]|uniref:flavin monoamine oxidase family protein n=1 Tax=Longimicrobium sp. TaxID=2029185 RepID=UPI002B88C8A5|nr:NAD(P)/FAD-dependent oxidoreductase [Longimicrobium sp.]HSU14784.1 NAD(P)/FAD-dependent oxidoreductase [Longimicrobium sp.]